MASQAQIAANRSNALKSTGPRSVAGKQTVAQNAITHGLFCRNLLLRGENAAELEQLKKDVFERLQPADAFEAMYAERYAVAAWKYQRALAAESKLSRGNDYLDTFDLIKVHAGEIDTILRHQLLYERSMDRALKELRHLQKERRAREELDASQNEENKPNSEAPTRNELAQGGTPALAGASTPVESASMKIQIIETNPISIQEAEKNPEQFQQKPQESSEFSRIDAQKGGAKGDTRGIAGG